MSLDKSDVVGVMRHLEQEIDSEPDAALRVRLLLTIREEAARIVREGRGKAAYDLRVGGYRADATARIVGMEAYSTRRIIEEYCKATGLESPLKGNPPLKYMPPPEPERGGDAPGGPL